MSTLFHVFLLFNSSVDGNGNFWIGLSRATVNDSFVWVDSSPLGYANWYDNQPSTGEGHNCVEFRRDDGRWTAINCYDNKRSYICKTYLGAEVNPPVTEPYPTPADDGNCASDGERWLSYEGMCYFFRLHSSLLSFTPS